MSGRELLAIVAVSIVIFTVGHRWGELARRSDARSVKDEAWAELRPYGHLPTTTGTGTGAGAGTGTGAGAGGAGGAGAGAGREPASET